MGVKAVKVFFNGWVVVIALLSLAVAYIISSADRIDPQIYVWHQYPVMFSPLIVLFNFALLVYWLVKRKIWALIPVLALVLNFKFITSIVGLNFGNTDVKNFSGKTITVSTFNVNYFSYKKDVNAPRIAKEMSNKSVDILAMQEFEPTVYFNLDELRGEFDCLPYSSVNLDNDRIGMAIFSKHPIIKSEELNFENTGNGALWADILIHKDTIRFICTHLQTTGYYSTYGQGIKAVFKKMEENFIRRANQVKVVRELIDTTRHPVIVCGDFNDTPHSFVYSAMKGDNLIDAFEKARFQMGGTFFRTLGLLRIDYIFHSKELETLTFFSERSDLSDHLPIYSVLGYKN
jgi:endonuclease/exonuclease/phosphatase family metal-dependent hydrolase